MRKLRSSILLAGAVLAVVLPGCVELDGQRLSWYYDADRDELLILLCYDGVHDSGDGQYGDGIEQIPTFVKSGDVMLLDWPFHVDREDVRKKANDATLAAHQRALAQAIDACQTEPVGYYREPDGKLGAAQLITIPHATEFVRTLNALVNGELSATAIPPEVDCARTLQRMQEAARQGHQWITLEGQSIRVVLPVHPGEWDRIKGHAIASFFVWFAEAHAGDAEAEQYHAVRSFVALLAGTPLSYIDKSDTVEIVLGRPKTPTTMRMTLRDEYEPSLEGVLRESVKTDLDATLAAALLAPEAAPSSGTGAVVRFGPPEVQVAALLETVKTGEPARRKAAAAKLVDWAKQWNEERATPPAPTELDPDNPDLSAWKAWYAAMKRYPLPDGLPEKTLRPTSEAKPAKEQPAAADKKPEEKATD